MNLLSWALGISVLVTVLIESLSFHEATVCRQEAWRGSFILSSRILLHETPVKESLVSPRCRVFIKQNNGQVTWMRNFISHDFNLEWKGGL